MAILKAVRKALINSVMDVMGLSPFRRSVVDMIRDDSRPDEVLGQVEEYLDEHYAFEGEGKRWNDLGYSYWKQAQHFKESLEREYNLYLDKER